MAKRMPQLTILPPDAPEAPPNSASFVPNLPPDLQFTPVPRRARRSNGLTPERQRIFIAMLAQCGSVSTACKAVGCSSHAIYDLRNSAGAESFAAAWNRAVERGARRVLDVMIDHAINGVPEYIYKDGAIVAERRHFNTRAQMWIVAHYLPERFGVAGGLMHSASGPVGLKRLKEGWRREWDAEHAAWELLAGPTDWSDFGVLPDYGRQPGTPDTNQTRPDIIMTMAMPLGEDGETVGDVLFGEGEGSHSDTVVSE